MALCCDTTGSNNQVFQPAFGYGDSTVDREDDKRIDVFLLLLEATELCREERR